MREGADVGESAGLGAPGRENSAVEVCDEVHGAGMGWAKSENRRYKSAPSKEGWNGEQDDIPHSSGDR